MFVEFQPKMARQEHAWRHEGWVLFVLRGAFLKMSLCLNILATGQSYLLNHNARNTKTRVLGEYPISCKLVQWNKSFGCVFILFSNGTDLDLSSNVSLCFPRGQICQLKTWRSYSLPTYLSCPYFQWKRIIQKIFYLLRSNYALKIAELFSAKLFHSSICPFQLKSVGQYGYCSPISQYELLFSANTLGQQKS